MSCSLLSSPSPQTVMLILDCFHLCRDAKTLAQRVKRARSSAGGQPPAGTSGTLLVVLSSPDNSPQRKLITRPSSTCVSGTILGADLAVIAGGGQQQGEPLRATPNTPPPSTTPPQGASPARAPRPCTRRRRRQTRAPAIPPRRQMLARKGPLLPSPAQVSPFTPYFC